MRRRPFTMFTCLHLIHASVKPTAIAMQGTRSGSNNQPPLQKKFKHTRNDQILAFLYHPPAQKIANLTKFTISGLKFYSEPVCRLTVVFLLSTSPNPKGNTNTHKLKMVFVFFQKKILGFLWGFVRNLGKKYHLLCLLALSLSLTMSSLTGSIISDLPTLIWNELILCLGRTLNEL